jgi:hypothetical protein
MELDQSSAFLPGHGHEAGIVAVTHSDRVRRPLRRVRIDCRLGAQGDQLPAGSGARGSSSSAGCGCSSEHFGWYRPDRHAIP